MVLKDQPSSTELPLIWNHYWIDDDVGLDGTYRTGLTATDVYANATTVGRAIRRTIRNDNNE